MHLINTTTYDSRELRAVFAAVYRKISGRLGPLKQWGRTKVLVKYGKETKAYAIVGGKQLWFYLPKKDLRTSVFTYLVEHEIWHLYGYDHRDTIYRHWKWPVYFGPWQWSRKRFGARIGKRKDT